MDKILMIGNQELLPFEDYYRMVIHKVLPEKNFKFKFGIRDKILEEVLRRGKRLQVRFSEFPDVEYLYNPLKWQLLGKRQKQVGLFKNQPMYFYFFYVGFSGELTKKRVPEGQGTLI